MMNKDNKNVTYLHTTAIDSFKYSIRLDEIDIINRDIISHLSRLTINTDTSEIIEETPIQENSVKIQSECKTYVTHYVVKNYFGVQHLTILINSKLLEYNYLQGIEFKNIEQIFNKIQSHNVVSFHSLEEFLTKGFISDIDLKKDIEIDTHNDMDILVRELLKVSKPSSNKFQGANAFTKKDNKGIEFNERSKSTYNHPFLKIYHKGIEGLNSKNFNFFKTYSIIDSITKRVRIEATIRSKDDLKRYGITSNTLYDVLKNEALFSSIVNDCITKNIDNPTNIRTHKPTKQMTPTEHVYFSSITTLIDNNSLTFERVLDMLISNIDDKVAKSRMKKSLINLYETQIKGLKIDTKAQKLERFFKDIDLM
jgi:hypothetical protein